MVTHSCSLWRGISSAIEIIQQQSKIKVGRGDRVGFWMDSWCCSGPLMHQYPSLFAISTLQRGTVAEHRSVGSAARNLPFRRTLYYWELATLGGLLQEIESMLITQTDDERQWGRGKTSFGPKLVYQHLEQVRMRKEQTAIANFSSKKIGSNKSPPRYVSLSGLL